MDHVMWVGPRRRPRFYVVGVAVLVAVAVVSVVVSAGRSAAGPARPGFTCLSPSKLAAASAGPPANVHVSFNGFTLALSMAPKGTTTSSTTPGRVAVPNYLVVSDAANRWVLPRPHDLDTHYIDQLCLVRFHHGAVPDVIIEGFSGGAHCCQEPVFYSFDSARSRYGKVVDLTLPNSTLGVAWDDNGGFEPVRVGGQILLRTEDDRFAYTFGCFACTPMPIRLDAFGGGGLTDVTGQYPRMVGREAAQLKSLSMSQAAAEKTTGEGPFGPLAAFVADDCALGSGASAWSTVEDLQKAGKLGNGLFYANTQTRGSFVTKLKAFLVKGEYCIGQIG